MQGSEIHIVSAESASVFGFLSSVTISLIPFQVFPKPQPNRAHSKEWMRFALTEHKTVKSNLTTRS